MQDKHTVASCLFLKEDDDDDSALVSGDGGGDGVNEGTAIPAASFFDYPMNDDLAYTSID